MCGGAPWFCCSRSCVLVENIRIDAKGFTRCVPERSTPVTLPSVVMTPMCAGGTVRRLERQSKTVSAPAPAIARWELAPGMLFGNTALYHKLEQNRPIYKR